MGRLQMRIWRPPLTSKTNLGMSERSVQAPEDARRGLPSGTSSSSDFGAFWSAHQQTDEYQHPLLEGVHPHPLDYARVPHVVFGPEVDERADP